MQAGGLLSIMRAGCPRSVIDIPGFKNIYICKVEVFMTFTLYVVGFLILIAGLAYGAHLLGVASQWIVIGVLVLLGLGVATGATRTRQKDPAE
jgi:hypothetical protein